MCMSADGKFGCARFGTSWNVCRSGIWTMRDDPPRCPLCVTPPVNRIHLVKVRSIPLSVASRPWSTVLVPMFEGSGRLQIDVDAWTEMRDVIAGPLPDIATRLSRLLARRWPHEALVIFTRECTGLPSKMAGGRQIVDRVTIDELDEIKQSIEHGGAFAGIRAVGGRRRRIWAVLDAGDTLLVLVSRQFVSEAPVPDQVVAAFRNRRDVNSATGCASEPRLPRRVEGSVE